MKTWLKEFGKFLIEPWVSPVALMVLAIPMGLLISFYFYLGGWTEAKETVIWQSLVLEPEPETCALCEERRHYAPSLVNLATGQVGELQIDDDPEHGRIGLFFPAGVFGVYEGNDRTCTAALPEEMERIDGTYFCRDCRGKLADTATEGYVLADLYDLEHIKAYPIAAGEKYKIREYKVSILQSEETKRITVRLTG